MRRKTDMAPLPARKELSNTPIKLCNEIGRLFRGRIREMDGPDGVMSQPGAHLVLAVLAVEDGRHQLELVEQTHLRAPTISLILKKMEAEGIVERKGDEEDRRGKRVYLTERGREIDRRQLARVRALDSIALQGISEEEIALLMAGLLKIRDNLLAVEPREETE